jgi:hypothetical protein
VQRDGLRQFRKSLFADESGTAIAVCLWRSDEAPEVQPPAAEEPVIPLEPIAGRLRPVVIRSFRGDSRIMSAEVADFVPRFQDGTSERQLQESRPIVAWDERLQQWTARWPSGETVLSARKDSLEELLDYEENKRRVVSGYPRNSGIGRRPRQTRRIRIPYLRGGVRRAVERRR